MDKICKIGGRECALRYTVNALCAVEELAGGSLDHLMERQFTASRLLLWGALIESRPEITVADAGEMIGAHIRMGGTLEEIVNLCADALAEGGFFGENGK